MSYDATAVLEARVRPIQKKLELTVALETASDNFDRSKGEQIAQNVDGVQSKAKDSEELNYPSGKYFCYFLNFKIIRDCAKIGCCNRWSTIFFQY